MFIDRDTATGQGRSKPCRGNLQHTIGKLDRVVLRNHAFVLNGKDPIQGQMRYWNKGRALLRCTDRELPIEFRDVLASQKVIGLIDGPDMTDTEFLRQPALPGTKASFTPASRLRRVGGNRLNPYILQ